jgi:GxxExxY protein
LDRQVAKSAKREKEKREMAGSSIEPDAELDALAQAVIGAAIEVHRALGPGYLEDVYERALRIELGLRRIPFETQVPLTLTYKGHRIGGKRLDLVVGGRLVVELKAVEALGEIHKAQAISYLKATGNKLALLINFNVTLLKYGIQRIVVS